MSDASLTDEAVLYRQVRWKCRRGMRELDQIMERYLTVRWADAPRAERDDFLALLDVEDDKLFQWLMGYEQCGDERLRATVERVRAIPPNV